jgi:TM2 domain-containing membrane protein YozV
LKSEDRAGWLATFIPGAGHFYAGKTWEGLASIAIQGLGVYYGVISWQDQYYLSAWLIGGGMAGSFHLGGVRRAQELVRMYNRKKTREFNEKVKEALLGKW